MDLEITILSELSQTDEDTQFTCHSPSPLEVFLGGVGYEMAWQRDGREFPIDLKKALVTDLMSLIIFSDYSCSLSHYWVSMCVRAKSLQLCPTLCDPRDSSLPGSSVHGILRERILERVTMPSSRGSSQPRDRTYVSLCLLQRQAGSLPLASPRNPLDVNTKHR